MSDTFEIICLGNELLIGKIVNSNAQWLAKYITKLGGKVRRITVVGDNIGEIATALRESLSRHSAFILTTGGLGPTFDDKTMDAVATVLEKPLELNDDAHRMVKNKYQQYEKVTNKKIELTPARLKMAKLPKDSVPLPNPVGTAPAVLSTDAASEIINLPGVPSEMKAIFEASVVPLIRRLIRTQIVCETNVKVTGIIESELAPLLDQVMREVPKVYVKSHPRAAEPIPLLELHVTTRATSEKEAKDRVEVAEKIICRLIAEHGGKTKPLKP
jgi:nicotinamide-nucleotide amidase